MAESGRHPLSSSSPTLLLKQGQLHQVAEDHILSGFEYLKQWRLCSLSGQLVLEFDPGASPVASDDNLMHVTAAVAYAVACIKLGN